MIYVPYKQSPFKLRIMIILQELSRECVLCRCCALASLKLKLKFSFLVYFSFGKIRGGPSKSVGLKAFFSGGLGANHTSFVIRGLKMRQFHIFSSFGLSYLKYLELES